MQFSVVVVLVVVVIQSPSGNLVVTYLYHLDVQFLSIISHYYTPLLNIICVSCYKIPQ